MTFLARFAAVFVLVLLGACAQQPASAPSATPYSADVRRTEAGVPHIRANDWGSLGFGYGYVQAEDNLCTLADAFVTYRGERSSVFGPDARPPAAATFGQPRNLDADFFFRLVDNAAAADRYRDAQPPELRELVEGFAAGYNRYVADLAAGHFPRAHAACKGQPWVSAIAPADIYRRLIAANLAGGAARFVQQIAAAAPAAASTAPQAALDLDIAGRSGLGSNALAFGAQVTHDRASLLFGNPHWFWHGPDRFYEAQLTIPGQLNVAGVSFLGVPVIMLGFNENVAWTHTVSSARRFGIFQLTLDPANPTRYLVDGKSEPMTPVSIAVETRRADGTPARVTRTLYLSRFGPLIDLSAMSPALAWNAQHAFALRDVNAENLRAFDNFLAWDRAASLTAFIDIQKRFAATPWVNTFAIGRGDARAWFADIGAMPDVPDALADACTPPLGRAFAARAPGVPFLDGSKNACAWRVEAASVQPGALPVSQMPGMARGDYIGNFNGSYWLTNANAPMTGYPRVAGVVGGEQTLRTRYGHALAAKLQREPDGITRDALKRAALDTDSYSQRLYKAQLIGAVCGATTPDDGLREPCDVLRAWNGTADPASRGANHWDEFWQRVTKIAPERLYANAFDPAQPLTTPNGFNTSNSSVVQDLRQALGGAALALRLKGFALDSPRGALLYVTRDGARVPLYGGCDEAGYFAIACAKRPLDEKGYPMDDNGYGNSYLQVVSFGADGVEADTMLAHSESDDPASPHFGDATRAYSQKRWTRFPFADDAIGADAGASASTLIGPRAVAR